MYLQVVAALDLDQSRGGLTLQQIHEQLHTADEATIGGSKLVGNSLEIAKNGPKLPQERDMVSVATPGHFWRA